MPAVIAKPTPQTRKHRLDLWLSTRDPQENERHLANGEKEPALTDKTEAERGLSQPELWATSCRTKLSTVRSIFHA
jgi:hypothetical protein